MKIRCVNIVLQDTDSPRKYRLNLAFGVFVSDSFECKKHRKMMRVNMSKFKKKKFVLAILGCGLIPNSSHALSWQDAQSLDILSWITEGFSNDGGASYVAEGSKLKATDTYLRNINDKGVEHDTALYMLGKDASLTLSDEKPNSVDTTFHSSIVSSYTGSNKSGVAVEIGDNTFAAGQNPSLQATSVDFFSDKTGLNIHSANVRLKDVSISALDTAISISDVNYNSSLNIISKGEGSKLDLENFVIKFDGAQFNKVVNDITGSPLTTPSNFTAGQKTEKGVEIEGTGVNGETIVHLSKGEINVKQSAVKANGAATVAIDQVIISTEKDIGQTVTASGQGTTISIAKSKINTHSTGVEASDKALVTIEGTRIDRQQGGYGIHADYEAQIFIKESSIIMSGTGRNGSYGPTPAAVSVRAEGKITLNDVKIEDVVSAADTMKGIYAERQGEVDGTQVSYKTASRNALGVHIAGNGKVSLKDSAFELSGAGSVGVFTAGGSFTADNSSFKSQGALLQIYNSSAGPSYINLNNKSKFLSDKILLSNDSLTEEVFLTADKSMLAGRINGGFTTDVNLKNNSEWSYSGISSFRNLSIDNSVVKMNKPNAGKYNILEVDKLNGQKATIQLWTEFSGDASVSDIIRIYEEASGKTGLSFKKSGGTGEQTSKGIKVVDAVEAGQFGPVAVTAADAFFIDASSDGYRQGKGTIAAGAYEYALKKGGSNADESWYLQSVKINDPGPDPDPLPRPEVDIYFANRASMLNMQQHHLKQRVMDGWLSPVAWVRMDHKQERFNNQFDNQRKSDMNLVHFGLDVLRKDLGDKGLLQIGVMGLIGQNKSKLRNNIGDARGKTDGYNLGAYASWQQNLDVNQGAYVDSWLMHGWFNNSTQGGGLGEEKYKSRALSLSLEAGYGFRLPWGDDDHRYTLQPQAQVILSHLHSDNVREKTKTQVRHDNGGQASYRMGVRFQGDSKQANGSVLSPFAELNFWHQPQAKDIRFDSKAISDKTPSTITEAVLGVKMRVKPNWDVSGQFNYQQGSQSYKQKIVQLGARYQW
jgi:outer membrane autotransporter protein